MSALAKSRPATATESSLLRRLVAPQGPQGGKPVPLGQRLEGKGKNIERGSQEAWLGEEEQLSSRLQAQDFAKKFTSEGLAEVMDFVRQEVKSQCTPSRS